MKNIILTFTMALLLVLFFTTCEKNDKEPKLKFESTVISELTSPDNGSEYVLTYADSTEVILIEWTESEYITTENATIPTPTYTMQIAFKDSIENGAKDIYSTKDLYYEVGYHKFNSDLLNLGMDAFATGDIDLRIVAQISGADDTRVSSDIITLTVTTFEPPVADEKLIYLLGEATPVGWDNANALPMAHRGAGVYARVETLDPALGGFFKFISVLTFWAPQWGTDATGTPEEGPLVYRPDEGTPDPDAIPVPLVAGNYYIEADTVNLTYLTFLTSGELYLVGSATTVGWDNTAGLPFTEVEPHIFEITTSLIDGGMKFLEVLGQWAPQWGTDATATGAGGTLYYRPSEDIPDPAEVPSPGTGDYTIRVDMTTMSYTISSK